MLKRPSIWPKIDVEAVIEPISYLCSIGASDGWQCVQPPSFIGAPLMDRSGQRRWDQGSQQRTCRWVWLTCCISSINLRSTHRLLQAPFDFSQAFDKALKNIVVAIPNRPARESSDEAVSQPSKKAHRCRWPSLKIYYCAYVGSFGEFACNPRTLSSNHLNHMVSLEGIVTKCSLVRPKVVKSVHYNEKKDIFHFREYRDQTMTANGAASTSVYPQEDEDGNPVR